jgi:hypothetical protein
LVLLTVSPGSQLKLVLVLVESAVEWLGVWESLSSSDELYHLSAFHDFNGLSLVFGVGGQEGCSYDFV